MSWFRKKKKNRSTRKSAYAKKRSFKNLPWMKWFLNSVKGAFFVGFLVLFVYGACRLYEFGRSNYFLLKTINIKGLQLLDQSEILQIGKLKYNTNIFQINLSEIKERLIKHPYIKEVRILKKLPQHLLIDIEEHMPFALLNFHNRYYLVSRDEFIMERYSQGKGGWDLPVVSGLKDLDVRVGEKCSGPFMGYCIAVLKEILVSDASRFLEITSVEIEGKHNITFQTKAGVNLIFSTENIHRGLNNLKAYLETHSQNLAKLKYLDLRFNQFYAK